MTKISSFFSCNQVKMNFVFLSKLLPLFLYPLGLSCLLLIIALILFWQSPRWMPFPLALALIILLISSNSWVSNYLVMSLEWQNIPEEELPSTEAIVLLGGATKSATTPRPMVDVSESGDRILYSAHLYQQRKAPLIIASGGRIPWKGGGEAEAKDMSKLLQLMGVPTEAIIEESESLNTYQNAVNVKKILREKGIIKILLVTSAMHMPRSLAIFQHQGIEAIPAPTDFMISEQELQEPSSSREALLLNALPDVENLNKTTKAIKEYIGMVVYRLQGWL